MNKLPIEIEPEMADPNQDESEEWKTWLPIESQVTVSDIKNFEQSIGCKIPNDYISLLMHKHFYELQISQASFCHPVNIWKRKWQDLILTGYPKAHLIEKGYLPFATWDDWGLLCFNTNDMKTDTNYPVVLWDHESNKFEDKATDFYELLSALDDDGKQAI